MNNPELRFSLASNTIPVVLADAAGVEKRYEMREMLAAARDAYLDRLSSRMRMDAAGRPAGVKQFAGMQADLISSCLFDSEGKLVPVDQIQKWPSSVVVDLFTAAQKLNHLNLEAKEDGPPKND